MTYYRMRWADDTIELVTPVRETPSYVFFLEKQWDGKMGERKEKKAGRFFNTKEEAKDYWIKQLRGKIDDAYDGIARTQKSIDRWEQLIWNLESKP